MTKKTLRCFLMVLSLILPFFVQAQEWHTPLNLTFDSDDTVYQQAIVIDTVSHQYNSWQIGRPGKTIFDSARSWPNVMVTDTLNTYPANDTSIFILGLRNYMSTSTWWHAIGNVNFYYQMDVDTGSKGIIEYSVDTGHTWRLVSTSFSGPPDTVTFTHSTSGWQYYGVHLFDPSCDSILLRFTFISDTDTATHDGWMIDDIRVNYFTEGGVPTLDAEAYLFYPNPATNILTIQSIDKVKTVMIFNSSGQVVYQDHYSANNIQIDVSALPPGIYQLRVNDLETRRFVKK